MYDDELYTRRISGHQINSFNREHLFIHADEPGVGGASHRYLLTVINSEAEGDITRIPPTQLCFQNGPVQDVGFNGITDEALLAIVLDRLKGFQRGPFGCRENAIVVTKLEESIHWLRHRAEDREKRGVEGTLAK